MPMRPFVDDCSTGCVALLRRAQDARRGTAWATATSALLMVAIAGQTALVAALCLVALDAPREVAWVVAAAVAIGGTVAATRHGQRLRIGAGLADWAAATAVGTGEALKTAIELAQAWQGGLDGSAALTGHTVRSALPDAQGLLEHASIARRRAARLLALTLSLAAAVWLSQHADPAVWAALAPTEAVTAPRERAVATLVGDLILRAAPPQLAAGALATIVDHDAEEATFLQGSAVTIEARPLATLAQISLQWRSAGTTGAAPLRPNDGVVAWSTVLRADLSYRFAGTTAAGITQHEAHWRRVIARPDAPPTATLFDPVAEVDVRRGQQVMIKATAADDIGLAKLELVVALPGGGEHRRKIAFTPGDREAEIRETIEVDALQLRADELATVHVEASDNNTADNPRPVSSRRVSLRMFSPERHHAAVLNLLAEQALQWTARLADRLEGDPARRSVDLDGALAARALLASNERRQLGALQQLLDRLAEDVLSRPSSRADLRELEELISERLAQEDRALGGIEAGWSGLRLQRAMQTIKRHHDKLVLVQERAVALMAALARSEHRQGLAREGRNLDRVEQRLEELLKDLAAADGKAEAREAERLLDALHSQVDRMLASLAQQLPLAPAEHVNSGAGPDGTMGALQSHDKALAEVRELLRAGKYKEALAALRALRAGLKATLDGLQKDAAAERTEADARLRKLVARLRREIAEARADQGQIREAARPHGEAQQRALAQHLRSAARDVIPLVQTLIADARDQVRPRRLGSAGARASQELARARAALSTAAAALESNTIDSALQALGEADEQFAAAQRQLPDSAGSAIERDLAAADAAKLREARDRVGRAAALLRESLPSPAELLGPGSRARLRQLQPRQRGARRRLRRAEQRLRRDATAHPALQKQVGGRLQHAMAMMAQAEGAMRDSDASAAMQHAAEAEAALREAASMLRETGQQQPERTSGVGFAPSQAPTDLQTPRPADGEAYREALLKAMRRPGPSGYRERLRRYYEAIAR